ncbi:MAG: hypothetical protein OEZ04_03085 [Nitrospinota bacterium]|nr:hypothetical protein [Nitrospinota bacterium]
MGKVSAVALIMALGLSMALVLTAATGCGRKGPPVAPEAGENTTPHKTPSDRRK